jgi:biofilm PGA synthesis lipoprotein PgaB
MRPLMLAVVLVLACTQASGAGRYLREPVAAVPVIVAADSFTVLAYHEVRREVRDYPDPYAVDAEALVRQFAWLRGNGFSMVSLEQILQARRGGTALPPKAVLLTFDDSYLSFYTRVYPLLREFGFPAVLGVVGKWVDDQPREAMPYGRSSPALETLFTNWSQLREMAASGLVEIASHTYDLHRGIPANPQGNVEAAATARLYDAASGRYEGDEAWRDRVRADLARNSDRIGRETGRRPRAVVWPYGSYNGELVRMAGELGMPIALTLDDGANAPDTPLAAMRRVLIQHNPSLAEFTLEERGPLYAEPVRVVQVRLDDVYAPDPAQAERNLSALLDRIQVLKPTHVYLQASADTNGDGIPDAAYFPNRQLPVRADLFNRVSWQLATRTDVKVYAVLPVADFRLPQDAVAGIYEDLARHAHVDGIVFEDASPPGNVEFTRRLAHGMRAFRAPLKTVLATAGTQGLAALAADYDYVALTGIAGGPDIDAALRRKLVFMLRNEPGPESSARMARQMRAMQLDGNLNYGYGPDAILRDSPPLAQVAPVMSLRAFPMPAETKAPQ